MQYNRLTKLVFAGLFSMFGLTACSNNSASNAQTETTTAAEEGAAATETAAPADDAYVSPLPADAPVVRVGITGTDEPFSFKNNYGNLQGLEVDIVRAIGEKAGFRPEFVPKGRSEILEGLERGQFDVGVSFFGRTPERRAKFNLTNAYLYAPNLIGYKDSSLKIGSIKDLGGLRVCVVENSVHNKDVGETVPTAELVKLPSSYLLYEGLLQGKCDVMVDDGTIMRYLVAKYDDNSIIYAPYKVPEVREENEAVMLVNKKEADLAGKINDALAQIEQDGTFDKINAKWLGEDYESGLTK